MLIFVIFINEIKIVSYLLSFKKQKNLPASTCRVCRIDVIEKYKNSHPNLPIAKLKHLHYDAEHKEELVACIHHSCERTFITRPEMQRHYKHDHLKERAHCSYCSKSYTNKRYLSIHLDDQHPEKSGKPKTFICRNFGCDASFSCSENLSVHNKKHVQRKASIPKLCPTCGGYFKLLKVHISRAHKGFQRLPCPVCGKMSKGKELLKKHIRSIHSHRETVSCHICSKMVTKSALRGHVKMVHDKIRHTCTYCKKSYVKRGDLKSHINSVHQGIKSPCRFCHMQFQRASDRNRHEKNSHSPKLQKIEKNGEKNTELTSPCQN